jgi:hypothetical protein
MKIVEMRKTEPQKIEVGDVVKGASSGQCYLIYKARNGKFNALNLEKHEMLCAKDYASIDDFVYNFEPGFLVKAKDVLLTLGGVQ